MTATPSMDVADELLLAMESDSTIVEVVLAAARKSKRTAEEPVTGARTRTKPKRWKEQLTRTK